ncbi:MAG: hypothetical protein JWL75_274 [Parcubacteria group bacterium]|nr:hypothetical protein [Parcubacteria group bacterium]
MKSILKGLGLSVLILTIAFSFTHTTEARARYGSVRVGGTNSHGKGSHYVGGYVRSCHGSACY